MEETHRLKDNYAMDLKTKMVGALTEVDSEMRVRLIGAMNKGADSEGGSKESSTSELDRSADSTIDAIPEDHEQWLYRVLKSGQGSMDGKLDLMKSERAGRLKASEKYWHEGFGLIASGEAEDNEVAKMNNACAQSYQAVNQIPRQGISVSAVNFNPPRVENHNGSFVDDALLSEHKMSDVSFFKATVNPEAPGHLMKAEEDVLEPCMALAEGDEGIVGYVEVGKDVEERVGVNCPYKHKGTEEAQETAAEVIRGRQRLPAPRQKYNFALSKVVEMDQMERFF